MCGQVTCTLRQGLQELDEAEVEEAKRRRQENEDQSMYDEFGRLKKKFRKGQDRKAREAAALARLRGDPVPVKPLPRLNSNLCPEHLPSWECLQH